LGVLTADIDALIADGVTLEVIEDEIKGAGVTE
jgi:hypothetical protein